MHISYFHLPPEAILPVSDSIYLHTDGSVRLDNTTPPWADFHLSESTSYPAEHKVVLFGCCGGTIQISEYGSGEIDKILWRTRSGGVVFRFDDGSKISEGNYYCDFEGFLQGESVRRVRLMLDDSGAYDFYEEGAPFPEENALDYSRRRKKDRLSNAALLRLAEKFGLSLQESEFWTDRPIFYVYDVVAPWHRPVPCEKTS